MACRICESSTQVIVDLGETPPANSLKSSPDQPETSYPLVLEWCEACSNVQLRDCLAADVLYSDYLYVTPRSSMLEEHYAYLTNFLISNGYMNSDSLVVEAGSNAGYFLEHIKPSVRSVLGVDPARQIVEMANEAGVPTECDFFNSESGTRIAAEHGSAQVVIARHCLAHNEWPQEMVRGAAAVLEPGGHLVIENAYLLNTIQGTEFDQIYHEHMFYYSIRSMTEMLRREGFSLVDVTMSLVHGGSIIFVAKLGDGTPTENVKRYSARERIALTAKNFERFGERTRDVKEQLTEMIDQLNLDGETIYTYGATAKGNTLLNYVGVTSEQIPYCVDSTPIKQGKFLPKSNIEVISEESALADPPAYFLLTAWNYQDEIIAKVRRAGNHDSQFIVPIPFVRIV